MMMAMVLIIMVILMTMLVLIIMTWSNRSFPRAKSEGFKDDDDQEIVINHQDINRDDHDSLDGKCDME